MHKRHHTHRLTFTTLFLSSLLLANAAQAIPYTPGFTWNRNAEFTTNGTHLDTQRRDTAGNTVWSYEWFNGWHTGADYTNTTQQTHIYNWTPQRWGSTVAGVNVSPWDQNTNYRDDFSTHGVSLTRWTNLVGDESSISISGSLNLIWGGPKVGGLFTTHPIDTLLLLGVHDVSADTTSLLVNNLLDSSPYNSGSCNSSRYGDCPRVNTSLDYTIDMDAGDSLFWTAIPVGIPSANFRWFSLVDNPMVISYNGSTATTIPEPNILVLLLTAGLLLTISHKKTESAQKNTRINPVREWPV